MIKIEDLETSTVAELKEIASEFGIEKISGMSKAKVISVIKRKINAVMKKREADNVERAKKAEEAKPVKVVKKVVKVRVLAPKDFNPADWNILGKEEPKLPIFENLQILQILKTGHNQTHLHCLMENGSTMHVPRYRLKGYGEGL